MGYTTFYALSWNNEEGKRNDKAIQEWIENDELRAEFEDLYECGASGNIRTLDSDPEMIRLSAAFPDVLFTLHGSGEDDDDLWISYYREGKVQHGPAEVRYPAFDPDRLVDIEH